MPDVINIDIVALIFDFDDTLAPDSTSALLEKHGIAPIDFWTRDVKQLVKEGYDPPAAWLKLLLENVGNSEDKKLGNLTNAMLREFGAAFRSDYFYPGVPDFFDDIEKEVRENYEGIKVEFYIVSGGLYEVISSTRISNRFEGIYGCHLAGDTNEGVLKYIKRIITFTEKTRYIFEINKGIKASHSLGNPGLVNEFKPVEKRRIPLKNMIYVGDGLTDIPCFSLIKNNGGIPVGVFDPSSQKKAKQAFEEFMQPNRVYGMFEPDYRSGKALGMTLRVAVANRCSEITLARTQPRREPAEKN